MFEELKKIILNPVVPLRRGEPRSTAEIKQEIIKNKKMLTEKFKFKIYDKGKRENIKVEGTLLHWILYQDQVKEKEKAFWSKVIKLIKMNCPEIVNESDSKGDLPLHVAIKERLDFLVKYVCPEDVNEADSDGRTPLMLALDKKLTPDDLHYNEEYAVVEELIKRGADLHKAAFDAVKFGLYKTTKIIVRAEKFDFAKKNADDHDILQYAINRYLEIDKEILADTGIDFDSESEGFKNEESNHSDQGKESEQESEQESDQSEESEIDELELEEIKDIIYLLAKQSKAKIKPSIKLVETNITKREKIKNVEADELEDSINWLEEILNMLKSRLIQQQEIEKNNELQVKWVSSFNFFYSRRPSHGGNIESDTHSKHIQLQASELMTRASNPIAAKIYPKKSKYKSNNATAGVMFILRNKNVDCPSSNKIIYKFIEINCSKADMDKFTSTTYKAEHAEHAEHANIRIKRAKELLPSLVVTDSCKFKKKAREINNAESRKPVDEHILTGHQQCHHSEQYICEYLLSDKHRQDLIDKLKKSLGQDDPKDYTVVAITLHIHSELYCCENCQIALLGAQHQENIKGLIIADLEENEFDVKETLNMAVFISAEEPSGRKTEHRFEDKDHVNVDLDLHAINRPAIFAIDAATMHRNTSSFLSSKTAKAGAFYEQFVALRKENEDLSNKNEALTKTKSTHKRKKVLKKKMGCS